MRRARSNGWATQEEGRRHLHELRLKDKDAVSDFVTYWSQMRRRYMWSLEKQAFLQVAWVLGFQDHDYRTGSSELIDTADSEFSPWWTVHARENRLMPMVEGRLSKLLARRPSWKVMPATADEEDEQVSQLSNRVMRHYWHNVLDMDRLLWELHWWAEVTGTAFLVATWDPEAGPKVSVNRSDFVNRFAEGGVEAPEIFEQVFGPEAKEQESFALGEAVVEARSLFDMFVEPFASKIEDANFVLIRRMRTLDYLQDRYGKRRTADLVPGTEIDEIPFQVQIQRLLGGSAAEESSPFSDSILTHEFWAKVSPKRPEGIHAVYAQGKELRRQPNPYQHKQIPVSVVQGQWLPHCLWGGSKVDQLMETQDRLNDIRSHKTEYMRLHVYPKILDPEMSDVDSDAFTTEYGERIPYTHPYKPEYLFPPPMPHYPNTLESDCLQAFQDLSDIHEVSTAQAPENTRSGRAILALQAQDDARFSLPIQLRNIALARTGRQVLSMLNQHITEERLVQITSDDYTREAALFRDVRGFIGADLVGERLNQAGVDYFRVTVEVDSQLPLSPEGQRLVISSLLEAQVLRPDRDRDMILRLFGLGSADPLVEGERVHRSMAMAENRSMASGQRRDPAKWNNHKIHLDVHLHWINSAEFERLDPRAQKLVEAHLSRHYFLMTNEMLRPQLLLQLAEQTAPQILREELQEILGQGGQLPADTPDTLTEPAPGQSASMGAETA